MEKKRINWDKTKILAIFKKNLAFLFALLIGNEIFYFARGNTYFYNISTFFSVFVIFVFCFIDFRKVLHNFLNIGILFYLFVMVIFVSYINAFFFSNSASEFLVAIKGTIVFALEWGLTIFAMLLLREETKSMASGLYFAVVLNFLFSIFVLITYRLTNYVVTFSSLFPQLAFYVPNGGDIQLQGFFREPAHLTNFLVISYFLLLNFYKKWPSRLLLFICVFGALLLAGSGNIVVLLFGYVFFSILSHHRIASEIQNIVHSKMKLTFSLIILGAAVISIIIAFSVPSISKILVLAIKSVNPLDESNAPRLRNNLLGFEIIKAFPFGTGFNMSSIAGTRLHPDWNVTAIQNYLLKTAAETSVFGAFVYLALWIVPIVKLSSRKSKTYYPYLATALLCTLLLETINGDAYFIHYFALGLGYCVILNARDSELVSCVNINIESPKKEALSAFKNRVFWD
jgi:hypothetical protein